MLRPPRPPHLDDVEAALDARPARSMGRGAELAWRAVAVASFGLGLVGAALPVLPTVPFLLLSAWAARKGWPAFDRWLVGHRLFGPPIVRWRERGAVPRRAKWLSSGVMAVSAIGMQPFGQIPAWVRVAAPAVMVVVGAWLWFRPEE